MKLVLRASAVHPLHRLDPMADLPTGRRSAKPRHTSAAAVEVFVDFPAAGPVHPDLRHHGEGAEPEVPLDVPDPGPVDVVVDPGLRDEPDGPGTAAVLNKKNNI